MKLRILLFVTLVAAMAAFGLFTQAPGQTPGLNPGAGPAAEGVPCGWRPLGYCTTAYDIAKCRADYKINPSADGWEICDQLDEAKFRAWQDSRGIVRVPRVDPFSR